MTASLTPIPWTIAGLLLALPCFLAAPTQAMATESTLEAVPSAALDCVSVNLLPPDVGVYPGCILPVGEPQPSIPPSNP